MRGAPRPEQSAGGPFESDRGHVWDCDHCGCRAIAASVVVCPMCYEERDMGATNKFGVATIHGEPNEAQRAAMEAERSSDMSESLELQQQGVQEEQQSLPLERVEPAAVPPTAPGPLQAGPVVPAEGRALQTEG